MLHQLVNKLSYAYKLHSSYLTIKKKEIQTQTLSWMNLDPWSWLKKTGDHTVCTVSLCDTPSTLHTPVDRGRKVLNGWLGVGVGYGSYLLQMGERDF